MEKTATIQMRINERLKKEMTKRAKELNMSLSAYIVYLAQKDLKKL